MYLDKSKRERPQAENTQKILMQSRVVTKSLQAKLRNVLVTEETRHTVLRQNAFEEIELFDEIPFYCKL